MPYRPQPELTTASASLRGRCSSFSASTRQATRPLGPSCRATCRTPGSLRSRSRTSSSGPSTSSSIAFAPCSCAVRFSGVSLASMRPSLMIITLPQVPDTSGRICVLRRIVCSPDRERIRRRTSMICFGSSPDVGSSSTSTSGLWISAWARPTRCRYPLESLPISQSRTSSHEVRSSTRSIRRPISLFGIPLIPATKRR